MNKGISPLIAAVILIAFVIAVAGIASGFFTGFIQQRQSEISEEGEKTVDCTVADFQINPDTVSTSTNTLTVHNTGQTTLSNWTYTVYDTGGSTNSNSTNEKVGPAESFKINFTDADVSDAYRIRVASSECPQKESIVNESAPGKWEPIY